MTEAEYVATLTPEQRQRYGIIGWVGKDTPGKRKSKWHFGCCYPATDASGKGIIGSVIMAYGLPSKAEALTAFHNTTWDEIRAKAKEQGDIF